MTELSPQDAPKTSERIAKAMAAAGLCSRRDAERWILAGRVHVNGALITTPAFCVTANDTILVDGNPLPRKALPQVWCYHKPRGLVTTHRDPEGRRTVFDDIKKHHPTLPRVISVGRLDRDSEGLLLLTTSGALARHLESPKTAWRRRYSVWVAGLPLEKDLARLAKGVTVEGIHYGPILVEVISKGEGKSELSVTLTEGKNREIRRVMASINTPVQRLQRISFGPFQLGHLQPHHVRSIEERVLREQLGGLWETFCD